MFKSDDVNRKISFAKNFFKKAYIISEQNFLATLDMIASI